MKGKAILCSVRVQSSNQYLERKVAVASLDLVCNFSAESCAADAWVGLSMGRINPS